jgi:hypothetical protein
MSESKDNATFQFCQGNVKNFFAEINRCFIASLRQYFFLFKCYESKAIEAIPKAISDKTLISAKNFSNEAMKRLTLAKKLKQ